MTAFRETTLEQLAIDHRIEINALTGTARLTVPVTTSPGRDSFGPTLQLGYESRGGSSPFGVGWVLVGVPSISVDTTRGVPSYREDDDRYVFAGEELVPSRREQGGQWTDISDVRGEYRVRRFRTRVERTFERFEQWVHRQTGRMHWFRRSRDGVVSVFGRAADGSTRIVDPDDDRRVFQWLLEAQYHPNGNAIRYGYKVEDDVGVDATLSFESRRVRAGARSPQRYLKRITYGNSAPLAPTAAEPAPDAWRFEVVFDYGEHGAAAVPSYAPAQPWPVRVDPFSTCRPGFELRTWRLCRRVLTFHRFPELGVEPCLVGATELTHREDPAGSVLTTITYRGYRKDLAAGGYADRALPALQLTYSEPESATAFAAADATDNAPIGIDGSAYQWVDLRNEGLPGILAERGGCWYFKESLGDGRFGPVGPVDEHPGARLGSFGLQDFDGDGNLDLVTFEGREAGFYSRERARGRWAGFRPFEHAPRVDFANARVQWVDLNGDAHADLLVDADDRLVWYPSADGVGFLPALEIAKPGPGSGGVSGLTEDVEVRTFFTDMNGDGLVDMVRVDDGRVEYWPNLGHGRFGAGVVMEDAPLVGGFGAFDARRVRWVDLDGSGTSDLLYIGDGDIRCWTNQGGNRFGLERRFANLPFIDRISTAHVLDFLGNGTSCLVWSTPLTVHEGHAIQYLPLTGGLPPRLLLSASNGLGRTTVLSYRSSARDYLRDKRAGRRWKSLLPHHVTVVARLEAHDTVGGGRLVTSYEYHDGAFDDTERRFVGFGLVDAYDADLLQPGGAALAEDVSPPSLVRRWFLTGAPPDGHAGRAAEFYAGDALAVPLPEPTLEELGRLTTDEQLDGYRALAGVPWREEVYRVHADGTPSPHPLQTSESCYRVRRLQPAPAPRPAVFTFFASESLRYDYQEAPNDPRISHQVVLDSDPYGNVERSVSIGYPRRPVGPEVRPEQRVLHAELSVTTSATVDAVDRFETAIEVEQRRHALLGLAPGAPAVFDRAPLRAQVEAALANPLAFHAAPAAGAPQSRLLEWQRSLYWDGARAAALPVGQVGPVTLLHHVERAYLPDDGVDAAFDGHATGLLLSADGHYRRQDGFWWAEDATYRYGDAATFCRREQELWPDGRRQTYTLDPHGLLVAAVADVFGNRVHSTLDYQALAAEQIIDANGNVSEVRYDPLGAEIVLGVRGSQLGSDGAPHPVGSEDLAAWVPRPGATAAAVLANPAFFLQGARRFFFHDLGALSRGEGPPRSILLEREEHVHDGEGSPPAASRVRVTISYLDGFGRAIQTKVRVDPGPAIQRDAAGSVVVDAGGLPVLAPTPERWLTSGHDVYNNKGWLVRRYEPFFSPTPAFEFDATLRRHGAATRNHYDAAGRIVRQDLPNGASMTSTFAAWQTRHADGNDNVLGSEYEAARRALPPGDPERRALSQAQAHADTPSIVEVDSRGRGIRVREVGAGGVERVTVTVLNDLGRPERLVDPRGLTAFTHRHDMLGRIVFERGMDSGDRWVLLDIGNNPVHRWDGRGSHTRQRYDAEGRIVETIVENAAGASRVIQRAVYGDAPAVPNAQLRNARGRLVEHFDEAGVLRVDRYDFQGEPIDVRRVLRDDYKVDVDWGAAVPLSPTEYRLRTELDGFKRIRRQIVADGTTREYTYAALGHVSEVRLSTADGRLDRHVIASDIIHEARGQRAHLRLGNGVEASYEYDPQTFRLQRYYARRTVGAARDYLDLEYTYDPVGNVTRWIDAVQDPGAATPLIQGLTASSVCDFTYDAFYRLATATGRVHQALLPHDYRSGLAAPDALKGTRHLTLNNGAAVERYTRTYQYDLGGNVQSIVHQGATRSWTTGMWISPTSNRSLPAEDLNGIPLVNPESWFDANGNTVRLPHLRSMTWDHANRLVRAVIIDRSTTGQPDDAEYYVYGADGLRVRRVTERLVAGEVEVTDTIYLDGCEIRRVSRNGAPRLSRSTSHVGDGAARLATLHQWTLDVAAVEIDDIDRKKLHYLLSNYLGSISLELDESGNVISYEEYFPYGGTSFIAGDSTRDVRLKDYRYNGKAADDATGLYRFEHRHYAPWLGHWLSPDPLGPTDGLNLYGFVHNNPIRFIDADGLQTTTPEVDLDFQEQRSGDLPELLAPLLRDPSEQARATLEAYQRGRPIRQYGTVGEITGEWLISGVGRLRWEPEGDDPRQGEWVWDWDEITRVDLLHPETGEPTDVPATDALTEAAPPGEREEAGTQGRDGDGDADKGTAHPADGSSGTGNTASGQTAESGSNGNATTGKGPGGSGQGTGGPGGGGIPGGQGTGGSGGRTRAGGEDGGGGGEARTPTVPPGYLTGPGGIPYSPDLPPPAAGGRNGIPVTDPSLVRAGSLGDPRSTPGSDAAGQMRPGGTRGSVAGRQGAARTGEQRDDQDRPETALEMATRWAGYLNFVFDKQPEGVEGGIPGGLGLLGLKGAAFQVLFIAATVVSTLLAIWSVVKSISMAAVREGLRALVTALRSPGPALRAVLNAARGFADETVAAARWLRNWFANPRWHDFFRLGGRWRGPGQLLRELSWDTRAWDSIRAWRNNTSFWSRPRLFGQGPHYNWEHIITQNFGRRFPSIQPFVNSYLNTWLRLPANFNSSLGNRLLPKIQFYTGAAVATFRSWQFGQWIGGGIAEDLYADQDAAPAGSP